MTSKPQIGTAHEIARLELRTVAFEHHATVLEDIAAVGKGHHMHADEDRVMILRSIDWKAVTKVLSWVLATPGMMLLPYSPYGTGHLAELHAHE
jgi:hypothetical protein